MLRRLPEFLVPAGLVLATALLGLEVSSYLQAYFLDTLVKVELLIIDDWFLTAPSLQHIQQLHTLIDRRHNTASTIYCTQLPPGQWHDRMEEKILADAIIDRITTNAHATVLTCDESMRKHFSPLG